MQASTLKYLVSYGGGTGPNVWDAEMTIEAENIKAALDIALERMKEFNGHVFSIEQED